MHLGAEHLQAEKHGFESIKNAISTRLPSSFNSSDDPSDIIFILNAL